MNDEPRCVPLAHVLVIIIIAISVFFISELQNGEVDTKHKQDHVDDYDYFYSDCNLYFSENKIVDIAKARAVYKSNIAESIIFQKEAGTFDEKRTDDDRALSELCKTLEKFSKDESRKVIHDLDNSIREDAITKECDARGCVYSN